MSVGSRIKDARHACKFTQEQLAEKIGVTKGAIANYENAVSSPKVDILYRIMQVLKVDANYLYQDDMIAIDSQKILSSAEQTHIKKYRALDEHGKQIIDTIIDIETSRLEFKQDDANMTKTKIIPLFVNPAAAGIISPVYGDDYMDYEVDINCKADFATRVQGDSMEPYILDGSIVLVKRQIDLRDGDVGIFFADGGMLCKQYCEDSFGNIYLFSLNRKRSDADLTIWARSQTSVLCYGKVIMEKRAPLPKE